MIEKIYAGEIIHQWEYIFVDNFLMEIKQDGEAICWLEAK
jgi:hypothetical protein